MRETIKFTKVSGAGNDFVLINNLSGNLRCLRPELAQALCSRHFGVGADGLIVIDRSSRADFLMDYYNADGSHGGMCGNGGRCAARYAFLNGITDLTMRIEALDYIYHAEVTGEHIKLRMKDVSLNLEELKFVIDGEPFVGYFIDTGAPHVVLLTDDVDSLDVFTLGRSIRSEARLLPEGANVDFVRVAGKNKVKIRTYERGVEAETLACGTGAIACAVMAAVRLDLSPPITVQVQSGEEMLAHFRISDKTVTDVFIEGSAYILFDGSVMYDDISRRITPMKPSLSLSQSAHNK